MDPTRFWVGPFGWCFAPVNDRLRLKFLHVEPADAVLPQLRDLAMIYELIDLPESQRIVSGVINETVTAATGDVRMFTPGKTAPRLILSQTSRHPHRCAGSRP
jgi:hypothetical protein